MRYYTIHQINTIAKMMGYPNGSVLYNMGIVEVLDNSTPTPTTPNPNSKYTRYPPLPIVTDMPCKGDAYYVYINDRLSFIYYEDENRFITVA